MLHLEHIIAVIHEVSASTSESWPFNTMYPIEQDTINTAIISYVGENMRLPINIRYSGAFESRPEVEKHTKYSYLLETKKAIKAKFYIIAYVQDENIFLSQPTVSLFSGLFGRHKFTSFALCDPNLLNTISKHYRTRLWWFQIVMAIRNVFNSIDNIID